MKKIGIVGWSTGDNSFGVTKPYLEHIREFGTPIILSPDTFIPELDLVILPGGKDITNSGGYSFWNSAGEAFLEYFDNNTLPKYIEASTPIYGTCRGFQTLLNHFGVPLIQNIFWSHGYSKDESDIEEHKVFIAQRLHHLKGLKHYKNQNYKYIETGSWHHQCAMIDDVERCGHFNIIGSTEDKVVEFIEHKHLPIAGAQTHVERDYNLISTYLIKKLLKID